MEAFRDFISHPAALTVWGIQAAFALAVLITDLARNNRGLSPLMKLVWGLTVLYSGLMGLAVYFYSGRRQIARDSLFRRAFRSDAHCYSGCGAGEIIGVVLSVGLFALGQYWAALVTFLFAYTFGFVLTVGPLVQGGVGFGRAVKDAFWGESTSIVVMEAAAIGVDLWVAGDAGLTDRLFWASLILSLTIGLAVAYPVNVALIGFGVKEGMMNPRET